MTFPSPRRRTSLRRRPGLERLEGRTLLAGDFGSLVGLGGSSLLANSVAVDGGGDTLVAGGFKGTIDFDPGPGVTKLIAGSPQTSFVARYDPAGNFVWARGFTQLDGNGQAKAVAAGPSGEIYVAGNFSGTVDFDPGDGVVSVTSAGSYDAFLVKLDSAGNLLWVRCWGGADSDSANALAVNAAGQIGVAGSFQDTVDLDPGAGAVSATSAGYDDISAQLFSPSGDLVWARALGGTLVDVAYGTDFDSTGALYLSGTYQRTVDFDPGAGVAEQSSRNGSLDAFVLKLDGSGGFGWVQTWGGSYADFVSGLSSDGTNVVVAGSFQGTIDLNLGGGTTSITSLGLKDAYVVKLDGSGTLSWAASLGSTYSDTLEAVATDGDGNIFLTGSFQGTVDFAPGAGVVNITSSGGYDGYVMKLDGAGAFAWARPFGGINYDAGMAVGTGPGGAVSVAGRYSNTASFGNLSLDAAGGMSMFVGRILDAAGPIPPSAPTLAASSDTGVLPNDAITAATTLVFNVGSAQATSTVKLLRDGVVVATRTGPGNLTDSSAPEGQHDYQAVQVDPLDRSSDPSPALSVLVDRTAPATPAAPRLNPADDAGTIGDKITSVAQPHLIGTSEPGAIISIVNSSGTVLGTGVADGTGSYLVGFDSPLVDGTYTVRVKAADAAGNTSNASASFALTISANPPGMVLDYIWAVGVGGSLVLSTGITLDADGNTLVVGSFMGTVDFDPGSGVANLSPGSGQGAFVAKYDPSGNYLWARAFAQTSGSGQAKGVAAGPGGAVYVVGNFSGVADFDPGAGVSKLTSAGGQDAFLVKLDSAGDYQWSRRWGGTGTDSANAVAVDGSGRVGVGGSFSSTVDLDPGSGVVNATSHGLDDVSAQVFTSSGDLVWARNVGGTLGDIAYSVAFDNGGSLYLGGVFQSVVDFDPSSGVSQSSSAGGQDAFVWKLDGTGAYQWSRTWGNGYADSVVSLSSDGVNVAAVGSFQGTQNFNLGGASASITSNGMGDAYVVKLTGDGTLSWATNFGSTSGDSATSVVVDSQGSVYVSGTFQGTVDFAPGAGVVNASSAGSYDGFVVKLDGGGSYQWAKTVGGTGYDTTTGLGINSSNTLGVTGRYQGPTTLGELTLASAGPVSMYVTQIPGLTTPPSPATPALTAGSDTGSSATDGITAAASLVFNVATAVSTNTVKLLRDGVVVATRTGPGNLTDPSAPQGQHDYQAIQVDGKGQVSDPSPALSVLVDRTAPAQPAAPDLNPADDAGTIGDQITSETQPRLSGSAEPGATATLLDSLGAVIGSGPVDSNGAYVVQLNSPLALGTYSIRVQITDAAGNTSATSPALTLTISDNPPGMVSDYAWSVGVGGSSVLSSAAALDSSGNQIVIGTFQGTVDFDPGPGVANLTGVGSSTTFVAKYDTAGNLLWARPFTQSGGSGQAKAVVAGPSGEVYVAGTFSGAVDFDPGDGVYKLTSAGNYDAFLVKLDSAGNLAWARRWGGTAADSANALAINAAGQIGVAGNFRGTVDLDPGTGVFSNTDSAGYDDISAQLFNPSGDLVWARALGGTLVDVAYGVAFDNAGAMYLGGTYQSTVDFDPGAGVAERSSRNGSLDVFVLKLNGSGDFGWVQTWGSSYADFVSGLATDGTNVIIAGDFQGTIDLDLGGVAGSIASQGQKDAYVVKLDGSGTLSWAASFGSTYSDTLEAVAIDGDGAIYAAGSFQGTVDFAPGAGVVNISSAGGYDGYLLKLDSGGSYQWAKTVSGTGYETVTGLAVSPDATVALTGRYTGPTTFGSLSLPSAGAVSMFVARVGTSGSGAGASGVSGFAAPSSPDGAAPAALTQPQATTPPSMDFGQAAAALLSGRTARRARQTASKPPAVWNS